MVTVKPADYFGLRRLGAVAPGKSADITIVNNLKEFKAEIVLIDGKIVAKDGEYLAGVKRSIIRESVRETVNTAEITPGDLKISSPGIMDGWTEVWTIQIIPDQIVTEKVKCKLPVRNGNVYPNAEIDTAKICVVERHHGTGRIGRGFVRGFGLRRGALASTVAHDSHNIVAVGMSDDELCRAINRVREIGGGLVVADEERIKCELPLPIAGLMSDRDAEFIAERMKDLNETVHSLGCNLKSPFMTLSFLALPVIPKLKITDLGLVDVEKMKLISIFAGSENEESA